jgi:signal transduction histidine kinase/tetratricopeptide (TPR) repeat protein
VNPDPQAVRFGGRYRALALVKEGQGISTWYGTDLESGRGVVLKLALRHGGLASVERRLAHEAEVLRTIDSPRVVPLLDLGREGDFFYMVMPRVEGETLEQRLRVGRLSLPNALGVTSCVLEALDALHGHGILHRDVKPSNVIVDSAERPAQATLIDAGFSVSEALDDTLRDVPVGTARYMSPEQAGFLDREVAPPSDLYAVGVLLFECLAGHSLFRGDSVGDILRHHLVTPPPELRALGHKVPRAVDQIVQRLLRKDPRDRYQSAAGARRDLDFVRSQLESGIAEPELVLGSADVRGTYIEPSFIGQVDKLEALDRQLDSACQGHGGLVLLEGESGLGKSRLLDEWAQRCRYSGALVLRGQGVSQAAQHPFQMLAGVVDGLLAFARLLPVLGPALRARIGDDGPAISSVLPDLCNLLGVEHRPTAGPEALGETRSLNALMTLLGALGSMTEPAVVLLDDSQWSDEMTLKLLAEWCRAGAPDAQDRHVVIVAAFRPEEVPDHHPLRELAAATSIALHPFAPDDIDRMVDSATGPVPLSARHAVRELSGGNPFLISAVLRGLIESEAIQQTPRGWDVHPERVAAVQSSRRAAAILARRLDLLPESTRRFLSTGAVLGKEFDVEMAATLAGLPAERVLDALSDARRRHLVWARPKSSKSVFVHDRLREALLAALEPDTRRTLHLRAAETLEKGEAQVFEIAYHFDAAGETDRALPFALAAAEHARRQHALELAESQYRIAERARPADVMTRRRVSEGLGDVLMLRGQYVEAQERLESAKGLAQDQLSRATIEGKLGELAFKRGDVRQASTSIERGLLLLGRPVPAHRVALELLLLWEIVIQILHTIFPTLFVARRKVPPADSERLAMRLYSRLAYAYWFERGKTACLWAHLREMNIAERYLPSAELAQAYSEHAPVMTMLPRFARGVQFAERSLDIRKNLSDVWGQGQSLNFLGIALYASARFEEALDRFGEALRLLEETGDRWEANTALWHMAYCHYRLGNLQEAERLSRRVHQIAHEIGDTQAAGIAVGCWAKAAEGHLPVAVVRAALGGRSDDVHTYVEILQAEALLRMAEGDASGAALALSRAYEMVRAKGLRQEYVAPVLPWLATALRTELSDPDLAYSSARRAALLRRAATIAHRGLRLARGYPNNLPHALRECALIAALRGRPHRTRSLLDASLQAADRQHMKRERALTLEARARVGHALGWPDAAADALAAREAMLRTRPASDVAPPDVVPPLLSLVDRFPRVLDAGRRIVSALSREAILEAARDAALVLLGGDRCAVHLLSEDQRLVSEDQRRVTPRVSESAVRRALGGGHVVVATEGLEGDASDSLVLSAARSVLCAPIFVHGEAAAYAYVTHDRVEGLFGPVEERIAEFIATLTGAALENAENFARIEGLSIERERLYHEAQKAISLRDDFLTAASHELRTPLTSLGFAVQSLARTTREGNVLNAREARMVASIAKQSRRLGELVDGLLDISRITRDRLPLALDLADVDLREVVNTVVSRCTDDATAVRSSIAVHGPPSIIGHWDRSRLDQIATNLLTNAIKFGSGHPIDVGVELNPDDPGRARLWVRDQGVGIDPADHGRIFERFERAASIRHFAGFGIGLWIVHQIVEALHGSIRVESTVGTGARFIVELPRGKPVLH